MPSPDVVHEFFDSLTEWRSLSALHVPIKTASAGDVTGYLGKGEVVLRIPEHGAAILASILARVGGNPDGELRRVADSIRECLGALGYDWRGMDAALTGHIHPRP